jgi:hypothetical protein
VLVIFGRTLLNTNFLPHAYGLVGNTRLLWINVIGDLLIGISDVLLSSTLAWLVRPAPGDLPYSHFVWAFGLHAELPEKPEQSGSGVTVLVADDEAALRQAVVQILRTIGYKGLEAQTSPAALEMAQGYSVKSTCR